MKRALAPSLLIRTSLVVTILAAVGTAGLNFSRLHGKITGLQANLVAQTDARQQAESKLAVAENRLASTTSNLKKTEATLEQVTAEKEQALATASAQASRVDKLTRELAKTGQERDEARDGLARYQGAGMEPEQIVTAASEIKSLRKELSTVQEKNKALAAEVTRLTPIPESTVVRLPAELKAKVVAADPKWRFIVLDAGENQGVLKYGELLVSRQGKLVARVKVSRVQNDRCVADLMPGWELAEILEGDVVIPAYPQS
jgi:cell shape-determining protein MreC